MDLKEAKAAVRDYIADWSEQKLAEVYAFNQDGKMSFWSPCGCLLGVASAHVLHTDKSHPCDSKHYMKESRRIGLSPAECGYHRLGLVRDHSWDRHPDKVIDGNDLRRKRLSAILRAEIRRRSGQVRPSLAESVAVAQCR